MDEFERSRLVGFGHSLEWVEWWLAFCAAFRPRMSRAEERDWFLFSEPVEVDVEPLSLGFG